MFFDMSHTQLLRRQWRYYSIRLIVHERSKFNLPASLIELIPSIGDHDTAVLMHNDGVVQGLSEIPFMQDYKRWGILTIGTGLGNARFTNRKKAEAKDKKSS